MSSFIGIIDPIAGHLPVLVREEFAIRGGDLEGDTLQRGLLVRGTALADDKTACAGILEGEAVRYALLDLDR